MKVTIEAFVTYEKWTWEDKPQYNLYACDMSTCGPSYVTIRKQAFEVEIPDDFDPRPFQLQALREQQKSILAEAQAKVTNIDEQIQQLLCLDAPKAEPEIIL